MNDGEAPRTRDDLTGLLAARGVPFQAVERGPGWAVVAPGPGARILGAGVGEENAFWVSPASPPRGGWWNAGGQRTWIAPEGGPDGFFFSQDSTTWTVPPDLDPGHYREAPAEHGRRAWRTELTARTARGSEHRVGLQRSLALEEIPGAPHALRIRFRHELTNRDRQPLERSIGLWSIIQLPCEQSSTLFAATRPGAVFAPYFGSVPRIQHGDDGTIAWLTVRGGTRFKAGISPRGFAGTVGFVRRSRLPGAPPTRLVLTAMSFGVDPGGTYVDRSLDPGAAPAPGGDAAQVYGDPGTGGLAFCEIEAHGPAPLLQPGESSAHDIAITIAALSEDQLARFMAEALEVSPLPRGPA